MSNLTSAGRNLAAHFIGTAEFSFSAGAATLAAANAAGFVDLQNLLAFTPKVEVELLRHTGSYRGSRTDDKTETTKSQMTYELKSDSWTHHNLALIFGAELGAAFTQSSGTNQALDALDFSTTPSAANRWYPLFKSGVIVRGATVVRVFDDGDAITVQGEADDDTFTATSHGLASGDAVLLTGSAVPSGVTAGTVYFVRDVTTNTFKLAATSGGSAINITTDGTNCQVTPEVVATTGYEFDPELCRIRFLTERTGEVTVTATYPAITDGDAGSFVSLTPLADVVKEGWGRLVIFDKDDDNRVVLDHRDFKCRITTNGANENNGQGWADFSLTIEIPSTDAGTIDARAGLDEATEY